MNQIYSGYDIKLNKEENKAYKGKMLKIEGNSYQETREQVDGTIVSGESITITDAQSLPITKFNIEGNSVQEVREEVVGTAVSGENITITDAQVLPIRKFNIEGNSKQETREGYNELPNNIESQTLNGLTITTNKDKSITIKGTTNANTSINYCGEITLPKGEYAFDFKNTSPFNLFYTANGSNVVITANMGEKPYGSFVLENDTTVSKISSYVTSGQTIDVTLYPMIYKGSYDSSKPYEQYGASPNIEFEALIESVGDNINEYNANAIFPISSNGLTITKEDDGSVTINGTATANTNCVIGTVPLATIEEMNGKKYTLSLEESGIGSVSNTGLKHNGVDRFIVTSNYPIKSGTFNKVDTDTKDYNWALWIISGTVFTNYNLKLKLSKGTSTGAYSPYGQGSIEIKNVNKNFLKKGIEFKPTEAGWYDQLGNMITTKAQVLANKNYYDLKANTTYTFKLNSYLNINAIQLVYIDSSDSLISLLSKSSNIANAYQVTPSEDVRIWFRCQIVSPNTNTYFNAQLELGETVTEYLEHQSQTKALYTQQAFRAIGDIRDRFVKKVGVWYEEHNIVRKILNGTEEISYISQEGNQYVFQITLPGKLLGSNDLRSSHFKVKSSVEWGEDGIVKRDDTSEYIYVYISRSDFRNWLVELYNAGTPVYVDYVLAEPELLECTPEQVEQLKYLNSEFETYEGVNHITTTNEVKPTMSFSYNSLAALPSIEKASPIESVGDNINYLPYPYYNTTKTENGITFTDNGDGTISVVGTATDITFFYLYSGKITELKSISKIAGKNVVIREFSGDISNNTIQISLYNADNSDKSIYLSEGKTSSSIMIKNESQNINSAIIVKKGTTVNTIIKPAIVLENSPLGPWSPYEKGSVEIEQKGENYSDFPYESTGKTEGTNYCGVKYKILNGYSAIISGKPTQYEFRVGGSYNSTKVLVPLVFGKTYRVENNLGLRISLTIVNSKDNTYRQVSLESKATITLNEGEDGISSMRMSVDINTTYDNTLLEYYIYDVEQIQTNPLYIQQPFRRVGDITDKFVKQNGIWYEEHNINRIIVDGVNYLVGYVFPTGYAIVKDSTKTNIIAKAVTDWAKNGNIICNKLKTVSQADIQQRSYCGVAINNEGYVMIKLDDSAEENVWTTDSINNFLSENPLTIDYELAEPELIECTSEQIEQLEYFNGEAKTYEGVNHIDSISTIKPTISLRYNFIPALPSIDAESPISSVGDDINLLDLSNGRTGLSDAGIIVFRNNDNTYTLNGTSTSIIANIWLLGSYNNTEPLFIIPKGTYIVNEIAIFSYDGTTRRSIAAAIGESNTYTLTEDFIVTAVRCPQIISGVTYVDKIIYPKLSKGTSTGAYSPYGQGSIEIKQVNKSMVKLKEIEETTRNGITYSIKNGCIKAKGICTANFEFAVSEEPFELNIGETYTFSGGLDNFTEHNGNNRYVRLGIANTGLPYSNSNARPKITFKVPSNNASLFQITLSFYAETGKEVDFEIYPMLEKGSEATEYVPHQSKTKVLYTQQPFRAIGDIKDTFVKKAGIWYEEHRVGRYIFTGNENWSHHEGWSNKNAFFGTPDWNPKRVEGFVTIANLMCSNFEIYTPDAISRLNGPGIGQGAGRTIYISFEGFTSSAGLKTELANLYKDGKPIYVDYELAQPLLIPCTPVQSVILDELENIQLYDGENYIYSINEVQPMLTLELYHMMEDYDCYISTDGFFTIPGTDIKFKVNHMESSLPSMPEASESSVRAAGRDGDYVLNTTYEPISLEIVCYTDDNLTITEKKEIEAKVNRFLNSIKNKTKRLAFELDDKFYDVKYNNLLTTIRYPAHLKFSIPLKSSESYAKDTFEKVIAGNNSEISDTINPTGALITINGPATLPIISLNDYSMEYSSSILEGARLEIDTNKSTVTHINSDGVKTNVMGYYNHQFPKIEAGENTLKVLSGVDDEYNVTVKWNDLKL